MNRIYKEVNIEDKMKITKKILRLLPEWFGLEDGINNYVKEAKQSLFFVSKVDGVANGFISITIHKHDTAEIVSMGVLKAFHGKGIGRKLVNAAEASLKEKGIKVLQVKTLGPSSDCAYYKRTRAFYSALGFLSIEENYEIWGADNPCLLMEKHISK